MAARLGVDLQRGLSESEAVTRLRRDGPNALAAKPPPSALELIARQFGNALVVLLLLASALSLALGELLDGAVILVIVLLNAGLGAYQEGRADAAARAVRALLAPEAKVLRDGQAKEIPASELVVGDIALLTSGDRITADGRLVEANGLELDESVLTGESAPVAKRAAPPVSEDTPLAERNTMAFASTIVARGRGRMAVTATGGATELGQIAALAEQQRPPTPLQLRLDRLASTLLRAGIVICALLASLSWLEGESLDKSVLIGVSLAVAAIPEGLPAAVTISLAIGMRRLAKAGAIVRRLQAVETLGSTSVICTDKTGTLTTNEMTLAKLVAVADGRSGGDGEERLLAAAVLASDEPPDEGERALRSASAERGLDPAALRAERPVESLLPFDSERKRMSAIVSEEGRSVAYAKGAPEALFPLLAGGGHPELETAAKEWTEQGLRVLLVARREDIRDDDDPERELEAVGLIGLHDPPRSEARDSVAAAKRAGVRTVMITGDHPQTARAIAEACGIGGRCPQLLTGVQLDAITDEQLSAAVAQTDVFARVVPAHKLRIVKALQQRGEVVAMTGDGVNDAPALAAAEVGIAMGRGGSDAAIDAAEIVLSDNDFSTIVKAIEGGRTIYRNILRFVHFLLAANTGEVLVFALAIGTLLPAPLTILQILLVNLLTDGLPAIALAVDPGDPEAMRRRPRPAGEGLLDPIWRSIVLGGVLTGVAGFASFLAGLADSTADARTMAFTTLVFAQLLYVFSVRGEKPFFRAGGNPALVIAVAASALIQVAVLVLRPLSEVFSVSALSTGQLGVTLALALVPFLGAELAKLGRARLRRQRQDRSSAGTASTGQRAM